VIAVVSDSKKETSSTGGMVTSVATSPLLSHRASSGLVEERMAAIEAAYSAKDFPSFGKLTMQDSNQFHAVCADTYPPIFYMNDTSRGIVNLVHRYNEAKGGVRAAYTFDAGPNAVVYCEAGDVDEVAALVLRYYDAEVKDEGDGGGDRALNFHLKTEITKICDVGREGKVVVRGGGAKGSGGVEGLASPASGGGRTKRFNTVTSADLEDEDEEENKVREVKMVYITGVGGGPKVLDNEKEALLNKFGLNCYDP